MNSRSAKDVAFWMLQQIQTEGELSQGDAVFEIGERFGEDFLEDCESWNERISRDVLWEFRTLKREHSIVWDRSERLWRPKDEYDD